eukprot:gene52523-29752_t
MFAVHIVRSVPRHPMAKVLKKKTQETASSMSHSVSMAKRQFTSADVASQGSMSTIGSLTEFHS